MKVPNSLFPHEQIDANSKNRALWYSRLYEMTGNALFALRALTLAIEYGHTPEANIREWWLSGTEKFGASCSLNDSLGLTAEGRGNLVSQQTNAEREESIVINLACLTELGIPMQEARTLLWWRDHESKGALNRKGFGNLSAKLQADIDSSIHSVPTYNLLPEQADTIRYLKTFENTLLPARVANELAACLSDANNSHIYE